MDKPRISAKIENALKDNTLVLFVGAGCSIAFGFPNWTNLVVEILLKLNIEYGDISSIHFKNLLSQVKSNSISLFDVLNKIENDPLNGTQYKAETKKIVYEYINSIEISGKGPNTHRLLWEISEKIITTNYDKVLEFFKPVDNVDVEIFDNLNPFQAYKTHGKDSKFLYKIHGDIDNLDTITLFTSDYDHLYNTANHNQDLFSSFIIDKTILFIGFSLTDPFVNQLLTYVNNLYNRYNDSHYILSTKSEDFTKYNVKTIQISDWNDGLITFLTELSVVKGKNIKIDNAILPIGKDIIENQEVNLPEDASALIELINQKTKEVRTKPTKNLIAEIEDIQIKLNSILYAGLNFQREISSEYLNLELRHIFDKIYSTDKIESETYNRVQEIRTNKDLYKWYDRSVIISAITCSLIHFNLVSCHIYYDV